MKYMLCACIAMSVFFLLFFIPKIFYKGFVRLKEKVVNIIKKSTRVSLDPRFNKAAGFLGGKVGALVLFAICFIIFIMSFNLVFVCIAVIVHIYIVSNIKASRKKKLKRLIDKQVLEALTTIKNVVLSGKSMQDAVSIVADDIKEPIKNEFVLMAQNLNLGVNMDAVLIKAADRAPSKEFKLMIDTIRISIRSGASISGIFEQITDSASQRIALEEKIGALTAQGKLSGTIVSIVPFIVVFMMSLLQPDMMRALFETVAGNVLLLIVVAMVLVGSTMIRKITEVEI